MTQQNEFSGNHIKNDTPDEDIPDWKKNPQTAGLRPLKPKGDPYSDKIRSKLKGSSSDKRKEAQILNKMHLMKPETIEKRSLELATNPEISALTIMKFMKELIDKDDLPPKLKIALVGKMIQAHTAIHGSKQNVTSKNLNMNADVSDELVSLLEATRKGTGV